MGGVVSETLTTAAATLTTATTTRQTPPMSLLPPARVSLTGLSEAFGESPQKDNAQSSGGASCS